MKLKIKTTAENGHIRAYLLNSNNVTILSLSDNESKEILLMPGHKYKLEYHIWSPYAAKYTINSEPALQNYPDGISFNFNGPKQTDNIITINTGAEL